MLCLPCCGEFTPFRPAPARQAVGHASSVTLILPPRPAFIPIRLLSPFFGGLGLRVGAAGGGGYIWIWGRCRRRRGLHTESVLTVMVQDADCPSSTGHRHDLAKLHKNCSTERLHPCSPVCIMLLSSCIDKGFIGQLRRRICHVSLITYINTCYQPSSRPSRSLIVQTFVWGILICAGGKIFKIKSTTGPAVKTVAADYW